jgi:hypothetical protein
MDERGRAVTFDGRSWSAPTIIDRTGEEFFSVSCASASFCVAVEAGGNASTFNGSSWSAPTTIGPSPFSFIGARSGRDGTASLTVGVPGPGTLSARQTSSGRRKPVLISPVRAAVTRSGTVALVIKPTAAARQLLRQRRSVKVELDVSFIATGQPATTGVMFITLKRPARK